MKRMVLMGFALALVVAVSALALQQAGQSFPPLDWAAKAKMPAPVAVLVEFGVKDNDARDWSGAATVAGATVVRREGYRFRPADKLVGDAGWEASSHRALRAPKGNPAVSKREPIVTVGVVYHLADVRPDATLSIQTKKGEKAEVRLAEVAAGKSQPLCNGLAVARLVTAATPVATGDTEDDMPAAAYGPDGTLWVAYVSYTLRDKNRRIESPMLKGQPKDFAFLDKPGFADQVWLKSCRDGKWGEPIAITGPNEDIARCAVAADGQGRVWVGYSAHRDGNFDVFVRDCDAAGKPGAEQRLTKNPGPDVTPVMCTDAAGNPWLAYQAWFADETPIYAFRGVNGQWHQARGIIGSGLHCWHPALAAAPDGRVALVFDVYQNGSYDIQLQMHDERGEVNKVESKPVAQSAKFEARPSAAFDAQGRLWIAYEEGPEKWGKDYGALAPNKGKPLYNERSVRVVCLDTDGKLKRPAAELPTSKIDPPVIPFDPVKTNKYERDTRYSYPKIGLDGGGRVWLTYRQNFGSRYTSHPGTAWRTYARRLDGGRWTDPVEVDHADGLQDHRPVLLAHPSGGLLVVHNTDGRFTTPETIDNQIYASSVSLPGAPAAPALVAHDAGPSAASPEVDAENRAVARMRKHRLQVAGKTYQYFRGEYHRHTEISWDGAPDGTLEDMFRYAIDAVQFDWIGNGDHDNGAGREYPWWLVQKFSDAYHVPGRFTPMFTYERSVAYPHGHRNVMFARRGILTLPRLAPAGVKVAGVHPDDTKMLYRYLHEFGGICASHTSATGMGTDWRDNDPAVEPIVEIYQGDRMSYEMEGAPKAGYDPQSGKLPANVAGWYPKGYINLALQKGYKLGFQSSSDHWSTHISFFVVLAEGPGRDRLLDAVKRRHCYGATDNILVDFRCGDKLMGDELAADRPPTLSVHVVGTADLDKVDVLRDSEVVATLPTKGTEFRGDWTDPRPLPGTHYYYVRVVQADNEMAWASPIWVELSK
jgi:hypothetical protein